jgi:hypothetical protein
VAGLSGAVLNICLHLGLSPKQADLVWAHLGNQRPAVYPSLTPSGLFKQIEDAATELGLTAE